MTNPTYCLTCGHVLGVGRFCTNCGVPVPGRHPAAAPADGAPPPPPPPSPTPATVVTPPPAAQLPPAARYPLFADPPAAPAAPTSPTGPAGPASPEGTRNRSRLPWLIGAAALTLVAGLAIVVLIATGDDDSAQNQGRDEARSSASDEPDGQPGGAGTDAPVESPAPEDLIDLTAGARATVPAVAPPSRDRDNRPVTFTADNLTDGDPRTGWRMPGDGTGRSLTFDLGAEAVLTEVGLINGYAKVDGPDNWYLGNRRIRSVQWEFDDGTRIPQDLTDLRNLQSVAIDPVRTTTVTLHLLEVSAPGRGRNGRDFTAISEVRISGARG